MIQGCNMLEFARKTHMQRMPPLNALRAFELAARLGSFKAAATEASVTHGAISVTFACSRTGSAHRFSCATIAAWC
jgi:hypothetical protein